MDDLQEFASSSNGDRWFLGKDPDTGETFVLHRGNAPSGGHETRSSVDVFLSLRPFGPEHDALRAALNGSSKTSEPDNTRPDEKTPSLKLAEDLRLGGQRRAKIDDNIVDTRKWDDEPAVAASFWRE